jgi:hypothetical protein
MEEDSWNHPSPRLILSNITPYTLCSPPNQENDMAYDDPVWRLRFEGYGVLDLADWLARKAEGTDIIAAAVLCEKLEAMGALRSQRAETRDKFAFSEAPAALPSPDGSLPSPRAQQR